MACHCLPANEDSGRPVGHGDPTGSQLDGERSDTVTSRIIEVPRSGNASQDQLG